VLTEKAPARVIGLIDAIYAEQASEAAA